MWSIEIKNIEQKTKRVYKLTVFSLIQTQANKNSLRKMLRFFGL